MAYKMVKQIKDHPSLRHSFMELASKVFDLSFEEWYENGFWTDRYIPYVWADGDTVIANASVNVMDLSWQGIPKQYVQIGTVMTDPAHRNKGLSRMLLREIIADWKDRSDSIYLFANSSVLDFYPKFGFQQASQYQHTLSISGTEQAGFKKLNMDRASDREILRCCYQKSNPFSALSMENNEGLLMFYCGALLKNSVFYFSQYDMICIAEQTENTLYCYDIFGDGCCPMENLLSSMASAETKQAVLGFTPKDPKNCSCLSIHDQEDTLFILNGKENIFTAHKAMFPLLSHA